ncbi:MAG: hypothetical protein KGD64_02620 [Candidatus Heimdallarchaeota archaeon]|nr:hypothetical protein [Candidatus Heimdallarchaeota archaeon]
MKRKIINYILTILMLLFLGFSLSSSKVLSATAGSYEEDFTSISNMYSTYTTVVGWGDGSISLPRKNPVYLDTIAAGISNNVFVSGSYAYVGDYNGYYAINIGTPDSLSQVGNYTESDVDAIYGSQIIGNLAYLANGNYGLLILDVTDKSNITKHSSVDLPSVSSDILVHNQHAFIPVYSGGLRVVNVTDTSNPWDEGGFISTSADAYGVAISGNYLYVAVSHAGLDVYDISTPTSPTFVDNVDLDGYAKKVEISGNYAYVACDLGGLQIVDISDPTNMTSIVHLDDNTRYMGVDIKDSYVFVAGYLSSDYFMRMSDISDPYNPIATGVYELPYNGYDVFVNGDFAYVAATTAGLISLRFAMIDDPYGEYYQSYAVARSNTVNYALAGEEFEKVTLDIIGVLDGGTSIDYYVSADGATNWEQVTPGVEHVFANPGRQLSWMAEFFTSDDTTTPVLNNLTLSYNTIDLDFNLVYPTHESVIIELYPIFDWDDVDGAYGYLLQVDTSPTFTTPVINESWTFHAVLNYTSIIPLVEGQEYFWRVGFYSDFDVIGRYSDIQSFTIYEEPVVSEFNTISYVILAVSFISVSIVSIMKKNLRK